MLFLGVPNNGIVHFNQDPVKFTVDASRREKTVKVQYKNVDLSIGANSSVKLNDVTILIAEIYNNNYMKVGIEAPQSIKILRDKVKQRQTC